MVFEWFNQYQNIGILFLQIILGILFIQQGISKLRNNKFSKEMKWKPFFGNLLGFFELGAAISIFGIYPKIGALIISVIMLGSIYYNAFIWKKKIFASCGWIYNLIILASTITIITSKINFALIF